MANVKIAEAEMAMSDVIGFLAYFPNSHCQVTRLTEMPALSIFCANF